MTSKYIPEGIVRPPRPNDPFQEKAYQGMYYMLHPPYDRHEYTPNGREVWRVYLFFFPRVSFHLSILKTFVFLKTRPMHTLLLGARLWLLRGCENFESKVRQQFIHEYRHLASVSPLIPVCFPHISNSTGLCKNKWDKLPIDLLEVDFQNGNYD